MHVKYAQLCHNEGLWSVPRAFSTILIIKYPRLSGSYCLFIADKNLKSQRSCASFHQNNERSGPCSVGMAKWKHWAWAGGEEIFLPGIEPDQPHSMETFLIVH